MNNKSVMERILDGNHIKDKDEYKHLWHVRHRFNKKYRKAVSSITQEQDDYIACAYCGTLLSNNSDSLNTEDSMTVDHIIPIIKGGLPNNVENVLISCRKCNKEKQESIINIDEIYNNLKDYVVVAELNIN